MLNIFLYFIIHSFPFTLSDIITLQVIHYDHKVPYYLIQDTYQTTINTFRPFSLLPTSIPSEHKKRDIKLIDIHPEDKIYQSYLNSITINNTVDINSYFTNDPHLWTREKGLSFGLKFKNESFSYVHSLYNSHIISKKVFILHNVKQGLKGKLFIGGVPNDEHLKMKYKAVVKVNEALPTWGFTLKKVIYNNKEYPMNLSSIISSNLLNMFNSDDLFDFMVNNVFNSEQYNIHHFSYISIAFQQQLVIKNIKCRNNEIAFVFDNVKMNFHINDLFDGPSSLFLSNSHGIKIHNFTGILLGADFLSLFNYTLFDFDNKQIEFYSDFIPLSIITDNTDEINKGILSINIIMCILNVLILIIIIIRN